jgi:hypothetical protein
MNIKALGGVVFEKHNGFHHFATGKHSTSSNQNLNEKYVILN